MNRLNFHNFKLLATLSVMFILSLASIPFTSKAQTLNRERKFEVILFRNLPVEVKEIKNLQKAEHWFRDMGVVVKNISDKPIYFIHLVVIFPDILPPAGAPGNSAVGFSLTYGRLELGLLWNLANPQDVAIKPGESHLFTIPEGYATGFEHMKKTWGFSPEQTNKIKIQFNTISFGDGTGFEGAGRGGLRDWRGKTPPVIGKGDTRTCPPQDS
ncbi:MAG: hypothetical protein WCF57_07175 [Pyrinomonadaceae bacterium]